MTSAGVASSISVFAARGRWAAPPARKLVSGAKRRSCVCAATRASSSSSRAICESSAGLAMATPRRCAASTQSWPRLSKNWFISHTYNTLATYRDVWSASFWGAALFRDFFQYLVRLRAHDQIAAGGEVGGGGVRAHRCGQAAGFIDGFPAAILPHWFPQLCPVQTRRASDSPADVPR